MRMKQTKRERLDRLLYQGEISLEEYDQRLFKHTHALLEGKRVVHHGSIAAYSDKQSDYHMEQRVDSLLYVLFYGRDDYKPNY